MPNVSFKNIFEEIAGKDPTRKKWIYKFFGMKYVNPNSNLSLDEYCVIMERDEKLKDILK